MTQGPPFNIPSSDVPSNTANSKTVHGVTPSQLSNPPSSRVLGMSSATNILTPFSGLSAIDLINLKEALYSRLDALQADPGANLEHVTSTSRMLALITAKIVPRSPRALAAAGAPISSVPTASGSRPILPVLPPPAIG